MAERRRPRQYAERTKVPIGKSRADIEGLLQVHGAGQVLTGIDHTRRMGFVGFTLDGRQYRMTLPPPRKENNRDADQLDRARWRALLLLIKAKLEYISQGHTTAELEFLAYVVLPNGTTVGAEIAPRLAEAYESGEVRALLPEGT